MAIEEINLKQLTLAVRTIAEEKQQIIELNDVNAGIEKSGTLLLRVISERASLSNGLLEKAVKVSSSR